MRHVTRLRQELSDREAAEKTLPPSSLPVRQAYLISPHFMIIRNIIKNIIQDHDDLHHED